jgi:hypothetical protein
MQQVGPGLHDRIAKVMAASPPPTILDLKASAGVRRY